MVKYSEIYRGHEITISRERSNGGWTMTYYSIFRELDWYECLTDFTSDISTPLTEFAEELRERIDEELSSPQPWGEYGE